MLAFLTLGVAGLAVLSLLLGTLGMKAIDHFLPGNEAKLMEAMRKLNVEKNSAEEQFIKELTLAEASKMGREFRRQMKSDPTGTNNLLRSIMAQPTSFRHRVDTPGGHDVFSPPDPSAPTSSAGVPLRGNRQDMEGMQQAVASLTRKSQKDSHVPATLRLTGRPTYG